MKSNESISSGCVSDVVAVTTVTGIGAPIGIYLLDKAEQTVGLDYISNTLANRCGIAGLSVAAGSIAIHHTRKIYRNSLNPTKDS